MAGIRWQCPAVWCSSYGFGSVTQTFNCYEVHYHTLSRYDCLYAAVSADDFHRFLSTVVCLSFAVSGISEVC